MANTHTQDYVINFKAKAEGLEHIIKSIQEIAGKKDINLTKGMSDDLKKIGVL